MAEDAKPAENQQQQITIHAQYVKDLSFESPSSPDCFVQQLGQPDVQIGVNVTARRVNEKLFEVELKLMATAKAEERTLFVAELAYGGLISAAGVSEDELQPLMMVEGPRLLFPFARAIMSDVTRDGGFLPLNLNPVDFVALYKNNLTKSDTSEGQTVN